jgi:2-(1,2-epoxy-1,2-dihydrophenyl)acetyl-CoA isomerase
VCFLESLVKYHSENQIAHVIMNRPEKLNSLSVDMVNALCKALEQAEKDDNARVIILSAEGKSFCAGGDLDMMQTLSGTANIFQWMEQASTVTKRIREMDKYIIAAVKGFSAGAGVSLALASDFIIADRTAKFTLSFAKVGLVPDLGLFKLLIERVPIHIAKEWISFANVVTAEEANARGLINRLSDGDVVEEAINFSQDLINGSPLSQKLTKKILNHIHSLSLEEAIAQENTVQTLLLQSDDYKEGVSAFFEKRKPAFKGN